MKIERVDLERAGAEKDTSVVIDVLRAFTTSAYAFVCGAAEICPVSSVDDAFELQAVLKDSLLMGEIDGIPIPGFDLPNSPSEISRMDLSGKRIILRSTAGTQGIIKSYQSKHILASSLCCASATLNAIRAIHPNSLTLVETGVFAGGWGDEDVACADMFEASILGEPCDLESIIRRVKESRSGKHFNEPDHPIFPASDLELALQIDKFDFFMEVVHKDGYFVMHKME